MYSKEKGILFHKFNLPVFKASIWVIVGKTTKHAIDYAEDITSECLMKQEDKKYARVYCVAYITESNRRRYLLMFKHTAKPGEIAHEVKHLINILFAWHGQKLSLTNDEMKCYYLEDMVDKVHSIIQKYKKNAILNPKKHQK